MEPRKSRQGAPALRKERGGPPLSPLFPTGSGAARHRQDASDRVTQGWLMGVKSRQSSVDAAAPSLPAASRASPAAAHQPFESPAAWRSARPERGG